jgi:hypothetical protein
LEIWERNIGNNLSSGMNEWVREENSWGQLEFGIDGMHTSQAGQWAGRLVAGMVVRIAKEKVWSKKMSPMQGEWLGRHWKCINKNKYESICEDDDVTSLSQFVVIGSQFNKD